MKLRDFPLDPLRLFLFSTAKWAHHENEKGLGDDHNQ